MLLKPEFTEIGLTLLSLGVLFFYHFQLYQAGTQQPLDDCRRFDQPCQTRLGAAHY